MKRLAGPFVAAALLASTLPAVAEPRDPARADALFREGREAMKQKDYDVACARFAESEKLDPAPGTLLNLAECEEKLGRLVAALGHVRDALDALPPRDERARIARERITAIERRIPRITLHLAQGTPPESRLAMDGEDLPASSLGAAIPVDPGTHGFAIIAPDGREKRVDVTVHEGEAKDLVLELAPPQTRTMPPPAIASAPPPPAPPPAPSPAPPHHASALPWVVGGIGVVGLVAAGVTGALLRHDQSVVEGDCDRASRTCGTQDGVDAAKAGKTLVPVFYGAAALGVVGLSASAILFLASPSDKNGVAFGIGPTGATVGGRF